MTGYPAHPLAAIFPLMPVAEMRELADDIVTCGLREPIVLLDGMVLDGRNRLAACAFAEVEPRFVDFDGDDALAFVLSHNLHRRHLTESQRAMVAARIAKLPRGRPGSENPSIDGISTETAAARLNVGESTVERAKRVLRDGAEELQAAVDQRKLTVNTAVALASLSKAEQIEVLASADPAAVKTIARQVRAAQQRVRHGVRLAHMDMIAEKGRAMAPADTALVYPVYYADPPWRFAVRSEETGREKSAENHYPTLPTPEIVALMTRLTEGPHAAVMFLWATNPMLTDALSVLSACGFAYVHHWIWDKEVAGHGYWGRDRHELLLIGRRGEVAAPLPGSQPETVFRVRKGGHSEKPAIFAETIERLYPGIARIELFARSPRPGWGVWGFESGPAPAGSEQPVAVSKDEKAGSVPEAPGTRQEAGSASHGKVGGVASACSALAAASAIAERRELDEDAGGNGVTAGETATARKSGVSPADKGDKGRGIPAGGPTFPSSPDPHFPGSDDGRPQPSSDAAGAKSGVDPSTAGRAGRKARTSSGQSEQQPAGAPQAGTEPGSGASASVTPLSPEFMP